MKKWNYRIPILLMVAFLLCGCGDKETVKEGEPFIYCVNLEETGLEKREFDGFQEDTEASVEAVLAALKENDESGKYKAAIPDDVEVESYKLADWKLSLYFNAEYAKMDKVEEVLCRAAVVQSLVQIEGVDFVSFYVDGNPLQDKDGINIGFMNAEEFVQNTGESLSSYQKTELIIYLPCEDGDGLVTEKRAIRYNSNMSIEKVIVEQLMNEPMLANGTLIMPPETNLLGVTVKEGICYVNFDDGFLMTGYPINAELSIAALANSIIDGGTAEEVQISVNGKTDVKFQGEVDLSHPISKNVELMEE